MNLNHININQLTITDHNFSDQDSDQSYSGLLIASLSVDNVAPAVPRSNYLQVPGMPPPLPDKVRTVKVKSRSSLKVTSKKSGVGIDITG